MADLPGLSGRSLSPLLCLGLICLGFCLTDLPALWGAASPRARWDRRFGFSSGYRKVFDQYAGILHQKYPELAIEGDNFPPPTWKTQLAQFISLAKVLVIMCVLGTLNPFVFTGMETPAAYQWLLDNKLYACLMVFFLGNALETQLVSTGAFEIALDDLPVWSKLESGRIPQPAELMQIIDNHFNMNKGDAPGLGHSPEFDFKDEL
eukprot:maker-scaffold1302_size49677-snap-gene-0.16 protein:Tk08436 transcript:maker-scaffold1302_size49677-snap-gene-0.16-mRNA-1 annotation:"similar to CG3887"